MAGVFFVVIFFIIILTAFLNFEELFEEFFDAHGQVRFVYYHDCNGRDGCNRKLPKSTLMLVVIRIVILYTTYE